MRDMKSNQRRRRVRLINTVEDRTNKRRRSAATALLSASETAAAQRDLEMTRQNLISACKAKSSTRLVVEHPGAPPMTVVMKSASLIIGSDAACDVQLNHEDVSPRHCLLQWVEGGLFCCDIAPRTGLFPDRNWSANGRWIDREAIQIGPYRLSLAEGDIPEPPSFSPFDRSPLLANEYPQLGLQFVGVEQKNNIWPVNRLLTIIGRGVQCKLRLNHATMAQVQSCLLRLPTGCWIMDLANDNTTLVNGRPVRISSVDVGDILEVGPFRVEVVAIGADSAPVSKPQAESTSQLKPIQLKPIKLDREPKKHPRKAPAQSNVVAPFEPAVEVVAAASQTIHAVSMVESVISPASRSDATGPSVVTIAAAVDIAPGDEAHDFEPLESADELNGVPLLPTIASGRNSGATTVLNPAEIESKTRTHKTKRSLTKENPFTAMPNHIEEARLVKVGVPLAKSVGVAERKSNQSIETRTPSVAESAKPQPSVSDAVLIEFIKAQQAQLTELKSQLDSLKKTYDLAAGQLISKKLRDQLEKPVVDTMQCHESMQASLEQFLRSIEH